MGPFRGMQEGQSQKYNNGSRGQGDAGPWANEFRKPLETGKDQETDSPLELSEEMQPC